MQLDAATLELLRCPLTHSELRLEEDHLIAAVGGLRYPVRDGIPVLLVEEAELPEGVESLDALREQLKAEGHSVRA
ncbi:MAG: Trm112 family protein [Planctomycetota bacterium]